MLCQCDRIHFVWSYIIEIAVVTLMHYCKVFIILKQNQRSPPLTSYVYIPLNVWPGQYWLVFFQTFLCEKTFCHWTSVSTFPYCGVLYYLYHKIYHKLGNVLGKILLLPSEPWCKHTGTELLILLFVTAKTMSATVSNSEISANQQTPQLNGSYWDSHMNWLTPSHVSSYTRNTDAN